MYNRTSLILLFVAIAAQVGCSGVDEQGSANSAANDGTLQVASEAVGSPWSFSGPGTLTPAQFTDSLHRPKIARAPSWNNYEWDADGNVMTTTPHVSRGGNSVGNLNHGDFELGNLGSDTASMPGSPNFQTYFNVVGIGIAQNTSHVYTWYASGTGFVSEGTSNDLIHYSHGLIAWHQDQSHPLGMLIDADISPNGQVYYYWQSNNGGVERSVGTSTDGGSTAGGSVTTLANHKLFSISFEPTGSIEAWYTDGTVVVSGDSLHLEGGH